MTGIARRIRNIKLTTNQKLSLLIVLWLIDKVYMYLINYYL